MSPVATGLDVTYDRNKTQKGKGKMALDNIDPKDHVEDYTYKFMKKAEGERYESPVIGVKLTLKNPTKDKLLYTADIELVDEEGFHLDQQILIPGEVNNIMERNVLTAQNPKKYMLVQPGTTKMFRGGIQFLESTCKSSNGKPVLHVGVHPAK